MLALYIILGVVGFLSLAFFITLFVLYHTLFYSPIGDQNNDFKLYDSPQFAGKEDYVVGLITQLSNKKYEDIYVESFDKLKLHAKLYRSNKTNKVAICFHGYRGTAIRDFSGGACELMSFGITVILIDERAHGKSEGHTTTFGKRERQDVVSWANKAKEILGDNIEIILVGISLGGATVLFSSELTDDNIKIIADSPYSTIEEILSDGIRKLKLPVKLFLPIINLSMIIFGHTNLMGLDASKSIKNSNHKVLIIHGNKDSVVNYEFSQRVYLENKDKVQYEIFDGADHGLSYIMDDDRYRRIIKKFIGI